MVEILESSLSLEEADKAETGIDTGKQVGEEAPQNPGSDIPLKEVVTEDTISTMLLITSLTGGLKIEVPKWDGKKDTYSTWKHRFLPFAAGNRFASALKACSLSN